MLVSWPAQLGALIFQHRIERPHPGAHHELPQLPLHHRLQRDQPRLRSRFLLSPLPVTLLHGGSLSFGTPRILSGRLGPPLQFQQLEGHSPSPLAAGETMPPSGGNLWPPVHTALAVLAALHTRLDTASGSDLRPRIRDVSCAEPAPGDVHVDAKVRDPTASIGRLRRQSHLRVARQRRLSGTRLLRKSADDGRHSGPKGEPARRASATYSCSDYLNKTNIPAACARR